MTVKIIKCSVPTYWYSTLVDEHIKIETMYLDKRVDTKFAFLTERQRSLSTASDKSLTTVGCIKAEDYVLVDDDEIPLEEIVKDLKFEL